MKILEEIPLLSSPAICLGFHAKKNPSQSPFQIHYTGPQVLGLPSSLKPHLQLIGTLTVRKYPNYKLSTSLGQFTTIFQAEVYAIELCARECIRRNLRRSQINIMSDSQAALKALTSFNFVGLELSTSTPAACCTQ